MTERKPHPDNALIDSMQDQASPGGNPSSAGGRLATDIGSRNEHEQALRGEDEGTRPTGSDNPDQDAAKGRKTVDRLSPSGGGGD